MQLQRSLASLNLQSPGHPSMRLHLSSAFPGSCVKRETERDGYRTRPIREAAVVYLSQAKSLSLSLGHDSHCAPEKKCLPSLSLSILLLF